MEATDAVAKVNYISPKQARSEASVLALELTDRSSLWLEAYQEAYSKYIGMGYYDVKESHERAVASPLSIVLNLSSQVRGERTFIRLHHSPAVFSTNYKFLELILKD